MIFPSLNAVTGRAAQKRGQPVGLDQAKAGGPVLGGSGEAMPGA
ncbi:hypothetical protein [Sphingopyxis sp.]